MRNLPGEMVREKMLGTYPGVQTTAARGLNSGGPGARCERGGWKSTGHLPTALTFQPGSPGSSTLIS